MSPETRGTRQRAVRVQPAEDAAEPVDRPIRVGEPPSRRQAAAVGVGERGPRQRVEAMPRGASCRAPTHGAHPTAPARRRTSRRGRSPRSCRRRAGTRRRAHVRRPPTTRSRRARTANRSPSGSSRLRCPFRQRRHPGRRAPRSDARVARLADEHGRLVEPPRQGRLRTTAAARDRRSVLDGIRHEPLEPLALLLRDERPELDERVCPVADPELRRTRREPSTNVSWSPGGTTIRSIPAHAWPQFANAPQRAPSTARSSSASSSTSIGSLPPSSSTAGQSRSRGRLCDGAPDLRRPGEHDTADPVVADERVPDGLARALDDADEPRRGAGTSEQLLHPGAGVRRQLRRLEDDGVAGGDRGRRVPKRQRERKVPGRDDRDDSQRVVSNRRPACGGARAARNGSAPRPGPARDSPPARCRRRPRRSDRGRTPRRGACRTRRRWSRQSVGRPRRARGRRPRAAGDDRRAALARTGPVPSAPPRPPRRAPRAG